MGVKVAKYISLSSRCAEYGDDGYFVEPHIIAMMLFDELKISNLEEFVNRVSITITEDEIKEFLDKKFEEENPELKRKMEISRESNGITNLCNSSIESIISSTERTKDEIEAVRYYFEPYSLQYFKTYTSILKAKCQTLLSVLTDINKCKSEILSEEAKQRLLDLDFHINSKGNIHCKDAERLADAIIYNVKDLSNKVQVGNDPKTYLTFKESKHELMKDDVGACEIYPREEIQIKDRYYAHNLEFIALSEAQQAQLKRDELDKFSRWMKNDFEDDSCENERRFVLQKVNEENK